MPPIKKISRLTWLNAALAQHRRKIAGLFNRMTSVGPRNAMQPAVFGKFLSMLEQVALAQDKEMKLLSKIEEIEQKHRSLRKGKKLKCAKPRPAYETASGWKNYPGAKKPENGLMWLIVFWYLCMRQKINQKKQALTAD